MPLLRAHQRPGGLGSCASLGGGGRGLTPAWRPHVRGDVGERGEHEQPLVHLWVRHLQPAPIRPLRADPVVAEQQQVEVDLARAPTLPWLPPKRMLELLQRA